MVGDGLVEFIKGDYSISDITLNRFFALHVIVLPLALIALVFVHIVALHEVGSNNPDGIEIKKHKGPDGVPLDGIAVPPVSHVEGPGRHHRIPDDLLRGRVLRAGDGRLFLEHANFEPANVTATPEHIAPVWYFTPYYAILRAVPDKLWGFVLFAIAVVLPCSCRGSIAAAYDRSATAAGCTRQR